MHKYLYIIISVFIFSGCSKKCSDPFECDPYYDYCLNRSFLFKIIDKTTGKNLIGYDRMYNPDSIELRENSGLLIGGIIKQTPSDTNIYCIANIDGYRNDSIVCLVFLNPDTIDTLLIRTVMIPSVLYPGTVDSTNFSYNGESFGSLKGLCLKINDSIIAFNR